MKVSYCFLYLAIEKKNSKKDFTNSHYLDMHLTLRKKGGMPDVRGLCPVEPRNDPTGIY